MAGRAPSEAINIATRHAVFLERLKTHEANKVAALLEDVAAEIRDRLSRVDVTDIGRANMERLISGVEKMLGERFTDYRKATREQLLAIAVDEARFGAREIGAVATNYEPSIPAAAQVRSAALSQPLAVQGAAGGKLLTPFLQRFQSNEIDRITSAMRIGFTQGDTTTQLTQRLLGTRGQQFRDGQLAITERSARAVVRTAISHMSSVAKMEVGKENADIVRGVRIVATLDSRTSTTCQSMDGREYPMDKAPLPPYHPNACLKGTMIETQRGMVPIEDVMVGDMVKTHNNRYRRVYCVMARPHDGMARTLVDNFGSSVSLTNEHPILTKGKGWVEVGDVDAGDVFFYDRNQLSGLGHCSSALVPQAVLTDAHNIVTNVTEELVSYGIFSLSAGVSSSVNLNQCVPDDEVGVVCEDPVLAGVITPDRVNNPTKKRFMLGHVLPECVRDGLSRLNKNITPVDGIIGKHALGGLFAKLSKPDALSFTPVLFHDEGVGFGVSHIDYPWVASTCTQIEECRYTGMVYNLAVEDDETYIANGFVVHNCRTTYTYALDKRFDVLDKGATRASRGADGGEQVPSRETYYSWLKDQPAGFQDEAIGPQRAKLLREGGLSADRFSRLQLDKNFQPLTLERMKELEPLAFDRAGLDA